MDDNEQKFQSLQAAQRNNVKDPRRYSAFVRLMRLILPLIALIIVAMLFLWPQMEDSLAPIARDEILPDTPIAQNELIKPRYESLDDDNQPFTVTADQATQDQNNPEIILLENPTADLLMKDGAWLAAKANEGVYEQSADKLLLKGAVKLFHDAGYQMITEELRLNLETKDAFSDKDVHAQGPEGDIDAVGLEADGTNNILIFKGPAKLTLNSSSESLNLKKAMP